MSKGDLSSKVNLDALMQQLDEHHASVNRLLMEREDQAADTDLPSAINSL